MLRRLTRKFELPTPPYLNSSRYVEAKYTHSDTDLQVVQDTKQAGAEQLRISIGLLDAALESYDGAIRYQNHPRY